MDDLWTTTGQPLDNPWTPLDNIKVVLIPNPHIFHEISMVYHKLSQLSRTTSGLSMVVIFWGCPKNINPLEIEKSKIIMDDILKCSLLIISYNIC
jgi:hypothetical protein